MLNLLSLISALLHHHHHHHNHNNNHHHNHNHHHQHHFLLLLLLLLLLGIALLPECECGGARLLLLDDATHESVRRNLLVPWEGRGGGGVRSAPRPIPSFDRDSAPVPLPEFPTLGPPMVWSFPAPPLPSSSPSSSSSSPSSSPSSPSSQHHIVPIYPGIKHPSPPPPSPLSPSPSPLPPERRHPHHHHHHHHRKKHCSYNNNPPPPPPSISVVASEPVTYPGYTIEAPESAPQPVAGGPVPSSS